MLEAMTDTDALPDRLRSSDFVTSSAARAQLGRVLVDALGSALSPSPPRSSPSMLDVLEGNDFVRSFVDVTTGDVAGITPPAELAPAPWPHRPLFALAADAPPLSLAAGALVPRPTSLPTATTPPAEKTAITAALFPIPPATIALHQRYVSLGDVSVGVLHRSKPEYLAWVESLAQAAAETALEGDLCTDLGTSVTTVATDVWGALATAQAFGGVTLALTAATELQAVYEGFGTSGLIASGAVVVVPVVTSAFKTLLVSEDNLVVQEGGPERLETFDVLRLGYDAALLWSARAFIGAPWAAAKLT
jgi:hypothetical protein